jgi:predicted transcriptional regulator
MSSKALKADVSAALSKKVDAAAQRLDRPRAWIVKEAVTDWIAREEKRHKMTLEGLAAVDAGEVFDHADVEAWAKSLGSKKLQPLPSRRARL